MNRMFGKLSFVSIPVPIVDDSLRSKLRAARLSGDVWAEEILLEKIKAEIAELLREHNAAEVTDLMKERRERRERE